MKRYLALVLVLLMPCFAFAKYTATKFQATSWCSFYPSPYVLGNFALNEASVKGKSGFLAGQSNVTIIFGFTGSFEFLPNTGTVTATGTEIVIHSYTITASAITVTLSTGPFNLELNSIEFNNIQIRATGASAGIIRRTGGTMRVDNKTSNPFAGFSLGDLMAETPVAYSSNATTQAATADVFAGSPDNQILRISVTLSGTCSFVPVTSFTFNTSGTTNALNDISNASLYYTSGVNSFSTANLFGTIANPNGAFTISGNQVLDQGGITYYFWLVYDIRITATVNNVVDATFTSVIVDGTARAAITGNPAGTRRITADTYYSIASGNWNNTAIWSRTSGGPGCSCAPVGGAGFVFVNNPVSLNASYTVDFVTVQNGGVLSNTAGSILTITVSLSTTGNGNFAATSSWLTPNLTTSGTGISTFSSAFSHSENLVVGSGTTLQALSGALLTVNGNIEVDGMLALATSNMNVGNTGTFMRGTGSITGAGTISINGNRTVLTGSSLTIAPRLHLNSNIVLTNNGTVLMQGNITGGNNNSTWINNANAVLQMGGTAQTLLATGSLNASATGNTVRYTGTVNQVIKSATYHHIYMSSTASGIKTLGGAITVNGDLTIDGNAQVAANALNITLLGDWINNSSHATPFSAGAGTVNFNGITMIRGGGTTNFNIVSIGTSGLLVAHSTPGRIRVSGNWINVGDFDHNNSDIIFNGTSQITSPADFSVTQFQTVIVEAGSSLTLNSTETDLEGDFTANGTVVHNSGLLMLQGDAQQNIGGASTALVLSKLEIDNSGPGVQLQRPVTLTSSLTLTNGKLTTYSTSLLTMNAGTTATSASVSSFVNGPMVKIGNSAFVFPIGKDLRRGRLGIGASGSATRSFVAEYFNVPYSSLRPSNAPLNNVSGLEYWELSRTASSDNVIVSLYWDDAAASEINNCPDLTMARWNGSAWVMVSSTAAGSCADNGGGSVTSIGSMSAFGVLTFASQSNAVNLLPVELLKFTATLNNDNTVGVKWTTATEINNDYFIVEKTKDAKTYQRVGMLAGAGTSNVLNDYSVVDRYPFTGVSYYRLKQVDFDGSETYSSLVKVSYAGQFEFSVYPNPTENGDIKIRVHGNQNDEVTVSIRDMNNRVVYKGSLTLNHENDILEVDRAVAGMAPGVYVVLVSNELHMYRQKLIVK